MWKRSVIALIYYSDDMCDAVKTRRKFLRLALFVNTMNCDDVKKDDVIANAARTLGISGPCC
ncbi:hypothetical protein DPMN_061070 [Dreissena polymorpha]|uniref:Uncharacterized protein n=1 Tax=Dreissena polymorpha TaxID=45954 RepID=A0A9D4C6B8_DREPO|nr:hypothetical protein DPMN_061070 [Dreissena polymorpha]